MTDKEYLEKWFAEYRNGLSRGAITELWNRAQESERETCAKICLAEKDAWAGSEYGMAARDCARSIRNQGLPKQPHVEIKYTRVRSNNQVEGAEGGLPPKAPSPTQG